MSQTVHLSVRKLYIIIHSTKYTAGEQILTQPDDVCHHSMHKPQYSFPPNFSGERREADAHQNKLHNDNTS